MSDSSKYQNGPEPPSGPSDNRLDTWKEIAAYLRREVRTVQRWEREQKLPVHRHLHRKRGTVYAYKDELDAWWGSQEPEVSPATPTPPATAPAAPATAAPEEPGRSKWPRWVWVAGIVGILTSIFAVGQFSSRQPVVQSGVEVSPLTTLPGREIGPSLSPDGTRIAYAADQGRENYEIFVETIGSGDRLQITDSPYQETSPEWSPDGRHIAFVRSLDGDKAEIAVISANGGAERRIAATTAPYELGGPEYRLLSWSRNGRWLLHSARGVNTPGTLYRVDIESGEAVKLHEPPPFPGGDFSPSVSPDGRWLAFLHCQDIGRCTVVQVRLTADYLTEGDPDVISAQSGVARSPVWTPDGSELIYSYGMLRGRRRLWRVSAGENPGIPREIPGPGEGAVVVAISPVAKAERSFQNEMRLVYTQVALDTNIYRAKLDSGNSDGLQIERIVASTRRDEHPQLSPSGGRLAFSSDRSGESGCWISDADGKNPSLLATFDGSPTGFPQWSPDGKTLVLEAHPEGHGDIYTISASGGVPIRLTKSAYQDVRPTWSRDGSSVYFVSNREGTAEIWKMPATGETTTAAAVQLTHGGGEYALETWDGAWLVYSRGPLTNTLRMISTNGAEEREIPVAGALAEAYSFALSESGVHYLSFLGEERQLAVGYYDLKTGNSTRPIPIDWRPMGSFTVDRGGRTLLFSCLERLEGDLMLVRGLR